MVTSTFTERESMKHIEKISLVLVVLWAISYLCLPFLFIYTSDVAFQLLQGNDGETLSTWKYIGGYLAWIGRSLFSFGCAFWLFQEAKKQNQTKWVWALFGLAFKIQGIIIFYCYTILRKMTDQKEKSEPSARGDGIPPPQP